MSADFNGRPRKRGPVLLYVPTDPSGRGSEALPPIPIVTIASASCGEKMRRARAQSDCCTGRGFLQRAY